MVAPDEMEIVGVRLVTTVPFGTVKVTVYVEVLTTPVVAGLAKLKVSI